MIETLAVVIFVLLLAATAWHRFFQRIEPGPQWSSFALGGRSAADGPERRALPSDSSSAVLTLITGDVMESIASRAPGVARLQLVTYEGIEGADHAAPARALFECIVIEPARLSFDVELELERDLGGLLAPLSRGDWAPRPLGAALAAERAALYWNAQYVSAHGELLYKRVTAERAARLEAGAAPLAALLARGALDSAQQRARYRKALAALAHIVRLDEAAFVLLVSEVRNGSTPRAVAIFEVLHGSERAAIGLSVDRLAALLRAARRYDRAIAAPVRTALLDAIGVGALSLDGFTLIERHEMLDQLCCERSPIVAPALLRGAVTLFRDVREAAPRDRSAYLARVREQGVGAWVADGLIRADWPEVSARVTPHDVLLLWEELARAHADRLAGRDDVDLAIATLCETHRLETLRRVVLALGGPRTMRALLDAPGSSASRASWDALAAGLRSRLRPQAAGALSTIAEQGGALSGTAHRENGRSSGESNAATEEG